jgi:hypothetical protein
VTKGAKKRAVKVKLGETKKQKRARLRKMASSGDPRQRLWAVGQLDEMSMARANKGVAADMKTTAARPTSKKARRIENARLLDQALHHPDPFARLRAQDALRGVRTLS